MANVVGERYQITIDKAVRDELGIKPGDRAIERAEGGRLVIDFMPAPHRESMLGIFRRPDLPPITDWPEIKDRAWAARVEEVMEVFTEDRLRHDVDR